MDQEVLRSATTDSDIEEALAAARQHEKEYGPDPYALRVEYLESAHILVIHLSTGMRMAIPVENLQGLEAATAEQLRRVEMMGIGYAFFFPDLDADFYVPSLLQGVYGNRRWMARLAKHGIGSAA